MKKKGYRFNSSKDTWPNVAVRNMLRNQISEDEAFRKAYILDGFVLRSSHYGVKTFKEPNLLNHYFECDDRNIFWRIFDSITWWFTQWLKVFLLLLIFISLCYLLSWLIN